MKPITLAQFHSILLEMAKIWPEIQNPTRAKRYFNAISDLEKDVVENIAEVFLDTASKMPLPVDFVDAGKAFRKYYFEKTGQYYSSKEIPKPQAPHKVECEYCYGTGFEWVEVDGVHAFCFCFCWVGDKAQNSSDWMFPRSHEIEGAKRKPFPVQSFKPKEKKTYGFNDLIINKFQTALKESQEFWEFKHKKNDQEKIK